MVSSYHTIYGIETDHSTNHVMGYRLGAFTDFLNLKYLFLRTKLSYVKKGAEFYDVHPDTSNRTISVSTSINYITFAPSVNLKTNFKYINFNLLFGPKFDFLIIIMRVY